MECTAHHCGGKLDIEINPGTSAPGVRIRQCLRCNTLYYGDGPGLTSLSSLFLKMALGDDKVRSAVSVDVQGTIDSIPQEFSRDMSLIQDTLNGFGGRLRQRLAQLQSRLHFLHGQLAGVTLAHPELAPLVETAKQALDLVVSRPDGPVAEPPVGNAG